MMQRFVFLFLFLTVQLYSANRGSSAPLISGDTFRDHSQHVFDEEYKFRPENVKPNDIIFVKTDEKYLGLFLSKYHPEIRSPYILITHNSDCSFPGKLARYLDDPKIIAWYGQNIDGTVHPKLHPIPIGIANQCWAHGNLKIFLENISSSDGFRPFLCYLNFAPTTYPKERNLVWDLFAKKPWVSSASPKPLSFYLQDLRSSKFVFSPRGNGLDCHRTWEALLMGAIPIVRSSPLDPLYEDLPVLIIDHWEQVTEEYLLEQYAIIKQKSYKLDKLFIKYWINQIRAVR